MDKLTVKKINVGEWAIVYPDGEVVETTNRLTGESQKEIYTRKTAATRQAETLNRAIERRLLISSVIDKLNNGLR